MISHQSLLLSTTVPYLMILLIEMILVRSKTCRECPPKKARVILQTFSVFAQKLKSISLHMIIATSDTMI